MSTVCSAEGRGLPLLVKKRVSGELPRMWEGEGSHNSALLLPSVLVP